MKEKLTVLFLINELTVGGAEQQLLELVKGLDKARFETIVLTLLPGGPMEWEFKAVPGVELLSLKRKGKHDLFCLFKVFRILRRMKVDVVQPFLTPANLYGLLSAILCRTPVKIMTRRPGIEPEQAPMGYRLYFKAEAFLARFADWVVPNSQAGSEYILSKGIRQERIKIIPNGVNMARLTDNHLTAEQARQKLGLPLDSKVVGTVARLVPVKGYDVLLQAAVQIQRVIPHTNFAIVGDGPLYGYLENLTQQLGLSSSVVFFGEQRDIGTYLSAFDLAVLPSHCEGCSNFLLEAMALGKPVVASDVIGNRDVVRNGETGFLVPPGNAEALAEAITALLQDPVKALAMGQRAKERVVTQFSLESMVRQYESLYEETLREKTSRGKSTAAGRRAAREMLLLCTTSKVAPTARERIARLLGGPLDWNYLLDLAALHGVIPLLAYNLAANDFSSRVPQLYLNRLKGVYNQTLYRNVILAAEVEKVLSRFSQLKIEAIPLKGVVLAEDLYDHPGLRSVGDMDILVRPQDIPQARACLTEMGYEVAALEKLISHPFHGAPFFKRGRLPMVLELHWGLDDRRLTAFSDQEIWHRAELHLLHGFPTLTLSPEDNLLFLAYHLTKHDSGLLKLLCDVAELLKKYEKSLDWDHIKGKARSWQIESAVYYSLKRAQDLLGAPLPASVLATIEPGAVRRRLLDLLVSQEAFVSPVKGKRLRNETIALAHSLMLKGPRQTLAALSRSDGPEERRAWFKTTGWIALVFAAGLGRYLARAWGRQSLPVGPSMGMAGTIAISHEGTVPANSSEWGSLLIGRRGRNND